MFTVMIFDEGDVSWSKVHLATKLLFKMEAFFYSKKFAVFVPFEALSFLVGKFVSWRWHVLHEEGSTAFLIVDSDEEFWRSLDKVVHKLQKRLYDLKQFPILRYQKLEKPSRGSVSSQKGHECVCVYNWIEKFQVAFPVYVDSLAILSFIEDTVRWLTVSWAHRRS